MSQIKYISFNVSLILVSLCCYSSTTAQQGNIKKTFAVKDFKRGKYPLDMTNSEAS